jgi:hypothetical protein
MKLVSLLHDKYYEVARSEMSTQLVMVNAMHSLRAYVSVPSTDDSRVRAGTGKVKMRWVSLHSILHAARLYCTPYQRRPRIFNRLAATSLKQFCFWTARKVFCFIPAPSLYHRIAAHAVGVLSLPLLRLIRSGAGPCLLLTVALYSPL